MAAAAKALLIFLVSTSGSFLGSTLQQPAKASSSTSGSSSSSSSCDAKSAACFAEQECAGCISGWGAVSTSASDCEERFPGVSDEQTCANQGASICCDLGDETTAKECLENRLFTEYWTCFMEGFHCSIDDIPCYDVNSVATAPPPSSAALGPPSASLYSDRDFGQSDSPTASPSGAGLGLQSLSEACQDVEESCTQDLSCADCYSDEFEIVVDSSQSAEGYSECRRDYLGDAAGSESASSSAGICDVVGSAFCCSGTGCQVSGLSVAYWGCVFDFFGCSTEEAACIGGGGSQSARSDDVDESFASEDDDVEGGVADTGEVTARSGGAAGSGRRLSALVHAYFSAVVGGVLVAVIAPMA